MDRKLLDILCCPVSKVPLKPLPADRLSKLNERIAAGQVRYADGQKVDQPLTQALVTDTETVIYRVDDDIPIMLAERGIPVSQLGEL